MFDKTLNYDLFGTGRTVKDVLWTSLFVGGGITFLAMGNVKGGVVGGLAPYVGVAPSTMLYYGGVTIVLAEIKEAVVG